MRKLKTAVITGPTGAIGQALIRLLLAEGLTVYAVCRPDSPRNQNLPVHPNLHQVLCDIRALGTLPGMLQDVRADVFYHLAWAGNDGPNRNEMRLQTENIQYTLDACDAAAKLGCQVFVGAGSQAEYGRCNTALTENTPCFPENGYGMAKLCAGQMSRTVCRQRGIAHIWPRILSVYGPYEHSFSMTISTITKLLHGEVPETTAGEQIWDYLYVDDAADAMYKIAVSGRDGAVYPLGSGNAIPLRNSIEMLRDAVDPSMQVALGAVPYASKQVMHLEADISTLQKETGFVPKVSFEDGICRTIDWIRKKEGIT